MKTIQFTLLLWFVSFASFAQVGVGNTDPKASLDVSASNIASPSNEDGILIPRIDNFPTTNPGADQDGMMVYVTGSGTPAKGFYYWDNGSTSWLSVLGTQNTLDQAYNQSGAGMGKNIDASDGAVRINGTDGFLVTGTFGSGDIIDTEITGTGTRMFFNPRKAAFRAGNTNGNLWDNNNIGDYSFAGGNLNLASGTYSTAFGITNDATGNASMAWGSGNNATGSGSTASGIFNFAPSWFETTIGTYASTYSANSTSSFNNSDRIFTIGNGPSSGARSNALTIYKSGLMNINDAYNMPLADGTNGQVMTTDGAGNLAFTTINTSINEGNDTDVVGSQVDLEPILDVVHTINSPNDIFELEIPFNSNPNKVLFTLSSTGAPFFSVSPDISSNIGIGFNNGSENTDAGLYNIFMGYNSGRNTISTTGIASEGSNNIAFGQQSLYINTVGNENIAIGNNALRDVDTGDENVAVGSYALSNVLGSRNVAIGNNAGFNETGSDKLYIENSLADANNALIYGEFGTDNTTSGNILRTNSQFQIGNPSVTGYAFPTTDGTNGQVMTTDGAGNLAFQDIIGDGTGNDWSLAGNSGTNASTNFIGTTDNVALTFRANNIEKLRLTTRGQIVPLNTGNSIYIGSNTGNSDDFSNNYNIGIGTAALQNATGINNTAIGYTNLQNSSGGGNIAIGNEAMESNTTGSSNTAIGRSALHNNTTGNGNTAIGLNVLDDNTIGFANTGLGYYALLNNTEGGYNTALGHGTLSNITTSSYNVAVGQSASEFLSIGNYNTAIGRGAGDSDNNSSFNVYLGARAGGGGANNLSEANESKSGNVFIGYSAGYNENNSNRLYVENSDSSTPLIYGEFDNDILRTNGEFQINDPSSGGYAFPTADGTNGQILTTDGAGTTSWTTLASSSTTASNGLTEVSNDIQLGGTLTQNTTITQGNFDLNFNLTSIAGNFTVDGNTLVVEASGDVGIGNVNPAYDLDIIGSEANTYIANIRNTISSANEDGLAIRLQNGTSPNNRFIDFFRSSIINSGSIRGNGAGVFYATTSDRRLKTNIIDVQNALETLKLIEPKYYEYKDFMGHQEMGFIAQDLKKVYPQAVAGDETDDPITSPMMVDYGRLTPILTAGVKELYEEIKSLKEENEKLKEKLNRLEQLENRLLTLEEYISKQN